MVAMMTDGWSFVSTATKICISLDIFVALLPQMWPSEFQLEHLFLNTKKIINNAGQAMLIYVDSGKVLVMFYYKMYIEINLRMVESYKITLKMLK